MGRYIYKNKIQTIEVMTLEGINYITNSCEGVNEALNIAVNIGLLAVYFVRKL